MIKQRFLDALPDRLTPLKHIDSPEFTKQSEMADILRGVQQQLIFLHRAVSDKTGFQALGHIMLKVDDTLQKLNTSELSEHLCEMNEKLDKELPAPQVNIEAPIVNMPTEELKAILEAIRAIKIDFNGDVKVTNQQDVVKALNDLKPLLAEISRSVEDKEGVEEVKVTNLSEIKTELPKEVVDLLKNLKHLNTTADRPLSVRLSDGSKYYVAVAKAIEKGIQAVAMGTTPSFKDSSGVPQRALVDGNGSLRTSPDAYTVKLEYSGSNPIYVGKAVPGTAVATAAWQIQKLTYSGSNVTDVQWASGSNGYTAVWDDRASYTYS